MRPIVVPDVDREEHLLDRLYDWSGAVFSARGLVMPLVLPLDKANQAQTALSSLFDGLSLLPEIVRIYTAGREDVLSVWVQVRSTSFDLDVRIGEAVAAAWGASGTIPHDIVVSDVEPHPGGLVWVPIGRNP